MQPVNLKNNLPRLDEPASRCMYNDAMNGHQQTGLFDSITRHSMGTDVAAATLVNTETDRAVQARQATVYLGFRQSAWLSQIHSGIVHLADVHFENGRKGDALICRTPGILLGVFTADCVPVLLRGDQEIGVIHAGWRGFTEDIFDRFFNQWQTRPGRISALIGPCICTNCYEVGPEVADRFHVAERTNMSEKNPHLNLRLAARNRLMDSGIPAAHIQDDPRCTACCPQLYSYRQNKTPYRNLSVIGLMKAGHER